MKQGSIPQHFDWVIDKFLRMSKHGRNGISNFHYLAVQNPDEDFGEDLGRRLADSPA